MTAAMKITLIAAMAHDRVIGTGSGGIPWHLPRDVRHFREYTRGKHLLMGRKTFEEMTGWFEDHKPFVVSRDPSYHSEIATVVGTVEDALNLAKAEEAPELVVIGGSQIYHLALPYADELQLTQVDVEIAGSVIFPDYQSAASWETASELVHEADEENPFPMRFLHLIRIRE